MFIYIIIWLLIVSLYFALKFTNLKKKAKKAIFLFLVFLLLGFISGFRSFSVGTDTQQYVSSFVWLSNSNGAKILGIGDTLYEPGYVLLNLFLYSISSNPRILILTTSLFINFAYCYFIYKFCDDYFSAIMIYIFCCQYLVNMCITRQAISTSIILLAFPLLFRKNKIYYIFAVLIASMFHYFSLLYLLFIPASFLSKKNFDKSKKEIVGLFLIVVLPIYFLIPEIYTSAITNLSNYSDYINYFNKLGGIQNFVSLFRVSPMLLIMTFIYLPLFIFGSRENMIVDSGGKLSISRGVNPQLSKWFYGYSFIALAFVLFGARFGLLTRMYYYFTPFFMVVPSFVNSNHKYNQSYYLALSTVIFIAALITKSGTYGASNFSF